jgi:hypothetical protein
MGWMSILIALVILLRQIPIVIAESAWVLNQFMRCFCATAIYAHLEQTGWIGLTRISSVCQKCVPGVFVWRSSGVLLGFCQLH